MTYPFDIQAHNGSSLQGTFQRINVVLGTNGSGKSSLSMRLADSALAKSIFDLDLVVRVEGGRRVEPPINLNLSAQNETIFARPTLELKRYLSNRYATLSGRLTNAFVLLRALEADIKAKHSDQICSWEQTGEGERPVRPKLPFQRLVEIFNETFPKLRLYLTESDQLYVKNATGYDYSVGSLSDGEKQILALLADLFILTTDQCVFIIDEPELNLHPLLSAQFWSILEATFHNCVFVYFTHSLSFAMRSEVQATFVIGHGEVDFLKSQETGIDLKPFLGTISGVIGKSTIIFVEGETNSFDTTFYSWVLGRSDIAIVGVGSSKEVISAATRDGIWKTLSPDIRTFGIVDRDYDTGQTPKNVFRLKFHEAESYLCHPKLVSRLSQILCNTETPLTEIEAVALIVTQAQKRINQVIAKRISAKFDRVISLSTPRSEASRIQNVESLLANLTTVAAQELEKVKALYSIESLERSLNLEAVFCQSAIKETDLERLLEIFEGKHLLSVFRQRLRFESPQVMLKCASQNIRIDEMEHLINLRDSLNELIENEDAHGSIQ